MARPIDLAAHIQKLVDEKQQHTDALSRIDQTLDQIGSLLGQNGSRRGRKPGRLPAAATAGTAPTTTKGKRRKRGKFAMSGDDSILAFVKQNKNATTADVNAHWKGEGRGGKADTPLSRLVKAKRLKRRLVAGERGSRYLPV